MPLAAPSRLARLLRRFRRAGEGTIPVEMALCAPVLIVMLLGIVDLGWFAVSRHKMARVAATLADLTSRGETVNEAQITDIFAASGSVASPFDFRSQGRAILSSIVRPAGATIIAWQRESPTGIEVESEIGTPGGPPSLPEGFVVRDGENLVVAEAFFRFQPLIGLVVRGEQLIYVQAFQRPRLGTLDQVTP